MRDKKGRFERGIRQPTAKTFVKGQIPWNKGKKGKPAWNKNKPAPWAKNLPQQFKKGHVPWTAGKKGIHLSPQSEFKKDTPKELHPRWQGGITKLSYQIRNSNQYIEWRMKILVRDGYTCQNCKHIGGDLQAHHIKAFSKIIKENHIKTFDDALKCQELWDIDNGITLCMKCHENTDTYLQKGVK